ncbi:hypothetical protein [Zobellella sp. DQSA1]|uniref:hypothetical protein n=1 Tax=Zobellella sp. DQSA1 TaxID=3342386 RepID=UPI0035BEE24F
MRQWYCHQHHGRRRRGFHYSDGAIETALVLKAFFGLPLRSLAETAMSRYKQLVSPKLSLRKYNGRVGEILSGVKVMNKITGLGMPIRQPVS